MSLQNEVSHSKTRDKKSGDTVPLKSSQPLPTLSVYLSFRLFFEFLDELSLRMEQKLYNLPGQNRLQFERNCLGLYFNVPSWGIFAPTAFVPKYFMPKLAPAQGEGGSMSGREHE